MIDPLLVLGTTAEELAGQLIEAGVAQLVDPARPAGYFRWRSGARAPIYIDLRELLTLPALRARVTFELADHVGRAFGPVTAIAGVASSGLPWSVSVADRLGLAHLLVRTATRGHGRRSMIEPPAPEGHTVVVIDDLVATGQTVASAIGRLTRAGHEVAGVLSIANWAGIPDGTVRYRCLLSYPQLLAGLVAHGMIEERLWRELSELFASVASGVAPLSERATVVIDPSAAPMLRTEILADLPEASSGLSGAASQPDRRGHVAVIGAGARPDDVVAAWRRDGFHVVAIGATVDPRASLSLVASSDVSDVTGSAVLIQRGRAAALHDGGRRQWSLVASPATHGAVTDARAFAAWVIRSIVEGCSLAAATRRALDRGTTPKPIVDLRDTRDAEPGLPAEVPGTAPQVVRPAQLSG